MEGDKRRRRVYTRLPQKFFLYGKGALEKRNKTYRRPILLRKMKGEKEERKRINSPRSSTISPLCYWLVEALERQSAYSSKLH